MTALLHEQPERPFFQTTASYVRAFRSSLAWSARAGQTGLRRTCARLSAPTSKGVGCFPAQTESDLRGASESQDKDESHSPTNEQLHLSKLHFDLILTRETGKVNQRIVFRQLCDMQGMSPL